MATRARRKITADEFLAIDFGSDEKYELVDGVIYSMTGGTRAHARVQRNLLTSLATRLRGSGCEAFGPDMAVRIDAATIRYPDVGVDCAGPIPGDANDLEMRKPRFLIEILSTSNSATEQDAKLKEYQSLPTVDTIAFIDPGGSYFLVAQRLGTNSWRIDRSEELVTLSCPSLGINISRDEIFARD